MPEHVAGTVIEAMAAERFLILPHPKVGDSFLRKATDYDAWLSRTRDRLRGVSGGSSPRGVVESRGVLTCAPRRTVAGDGY